MKKVALICVLALASVGCASQQDKHVEWQQSSTAELAQTAVSLQSNLWLNMMPMITESGSEPAILLHGSLQLSGVSDLAADMEVEAVTIRQGGQLWNIPAQNLEVRTFSTARWEVVFQSDIELDESKPVDVAVELKQAQASVTLVDNQVKVEKVY
ncbi:hypothetical protein BCU68_06600 [Vibrio sp. 10N.286.49.B3]|uniref:hypothetical protein n=1 Tax=Vibrio sp. 10N.286.49.B3 TaxID=1880855 RepID=UPI000C840798|nr:hypothetical protein [Vibrio sp. 10N.286.49.B3]PMH39765.1 hypothetical protein BCU68_06600 [Vibrio sp. 10N.286.49.B3]